MALTRKKKFFIFCAASAFFIFLIYNFFKFDGRDFKINYSKAITSSNGELLRVFLNDDEQFLIPVSLSKVNSNIINTITAVEDKRFFSHPGFDVFAIARAAFVNLKAQKIKTGASTITMQTARLLDPSPRTFFVKFKELIRSVQIEINFKKTETLQMYLNLLPFGGNIKGIETAAYFYYNKTAENLNILEAATLCAMPKNPNVYSFNNPERLKKRRNFILKNLYEKEKITLSEYETYSKAPVDRSRYYFFQAPHFTEYVAANVSETGKIKTTLDLNYQRALEDVIKIHSANLKNYNIHNLSGVILNNNNFEILAWAGSQDYFDKEHGGQIQGLLMNRSPGSALKPFLYLMEIDEGNITPATKLPDLPVYYVGFNPENASKTYEGLVQADYALQNSLNVPAVMLLDKAGIDNFKSYLQDFGITTLNRPAEHYGLGLAIGGCDIKPIELAAAYAALAGGGELAGVSFLKGEEKIKYRAASKEASFITADILRDVSDRAAYGGVMFSYKTGTSANHRDAFCVGFNPEITVLIWAGNFSGETSKYLMGPRAAYPAVRDIFRRLYPSVSPWYKKPVGVQTKEFCALSGRDLKEECSRKISAYYIPGKTKIQECPIHKVYWVDEEEKYSYCSVCMPPISRKKIKQKVYENYSPAVLNFFERTGRYIKKIPPHNPSCPYHKSPAGIEIVYPPDGSVFFMDKQAEKFKIPFKTAVSGSAKKIFYFLNGVLLEEKENTQTVFFAPEPGDYELVCVTDENTYAKIKFTVK